MLPPLYLQVLPCKSLAQRCKHACAAFQNACAALQTRLCSVANPLVQRYRTLVQRCRRLCSAPHLHYLLTEGSAAWAVALKSGRRPRRPARALAGGLRLVTEGYSGAPPLPPTWCSSPRGHLPRTRTLVIYSVFCSWCSKTSCFTVFRALRGFRNFILVPAKTTRFTWLGGSGGGPEWKK